MEPGQAGQDRRDVLSGGAGDEPSRRRWPVWVAGLALAAVGLVLLRPDLSLLASDRGTPAPSPYRPYSSGGANSLEGVAWRPRGDLVGDRGFVTRALARIREERADATRVYFAGRLPDGSRLLLAGTDVNRGVVATSVHALHVPVDVPLQGARVTETAALVDPQQVLAWAGRGADGRVMAVALTRPGPVSFEVSAQVRFDPADGRASRQWTPAPAGNGVFVADLGSDTDPIVVVRAAGPGVFVQPLLVRVEPPVPSRSPLALAGIDDPAYAGPDEQHVTRALRAQAGAVIDLASARLSVLWSGAPWKQRPLALVLIARPDGRRFQALVGQQGKTEFPAGVRALPAGASDRLPWLLEPFSPADPTLLLFPTGDGTLLYRRAGQATQTLQIGTDGVVGLVAPGPSAPSASGARITVLDPGGRLVLRTTLPPAGFGDLLALD